MTAVEQGSLAVLAMTNRLVDTGVSPLKASEVWRVLARVDDPADLLGLDERAAADLTPGTGVEPARLVRLLDPGIGLAARLDALHERGITALTLVDAHYPRRLHDRLGTSAPPVLYCAGELSLLAHDGIGMVGSRDVGADGIDATRAVAREIVRSDHAVVSGGAKGVDSIAMAAAYDAGGAAVGVLADSLERAIGLAENRQAIIDGRACLCTPYRPDARFTTGAAMGRNKIVYGLSRATLVVASAKNEGGTWAGATESLRKRYGRVAIWTGPGAGPGNDALVDAGGIPVDRPEALLALDAIEPDAIEPDAMPDDSQLALTLDAGPTPGSTDPDGPAAPSERPERDGHPDGDPTTAPRPGGERT